MSTVVTAGVVALAVVSITSHEAAHGFVADRLGDPTARQQGRLTLNPVPHIDLFFTILLPLFLVLSGTGFIFGGAKPVPVNVSRLRHPRRDWALVGAAGPATNLLIAVLCTLVLSAATHAGLAGPYSALTRVLTGGIFVNVLLAVFNLVPIPPLDGSRVLQYFLSGSSLDFYRRLENYGLLILLGLIFFVPPLMNAVSAVMFTIIELLTAPLGVWDEVQGVLVQALR